MHNVANIQQNRKTHLSSECTTLHLCNIKKLHFSSSYEDNYYFFLFAYKELTFLVTRSLFFTKFSSDLRNLPKRQNVTAAHQWRSVDTNDSDLNCEHAEPSPNNSLQ